MTPARRQPPGVWTTEGYFSGRPKGPAVSAAAQIAGLLDSPEIAALVSELEATRWTGRPGYPLRSMVGMAVAKSLLLRRNRSGLQSLGRPRARPATRAAAGHLRRDDASAGTEMRRIWPDIVRRISSGQALRRRRKRTSLVGGIHRTA